ncbi:hypothetical protein [Nocardia seriolae]|uniref:N-acetyltransferase domain-containing protein n=1 Tax=Nocardia seriolae TaxID=37332 RepID=A0ABC8AND4_9NOCA|nr:hypothetical protein [Nocardia seriolae]APA95665.1 uncharacterized protein NS506_01595 [Nocardia seriolae]MTJ66211.1 hypothetical protein [Nocardia seriolae]MTJ74759.1 hypothetical protein [Nocardia seriolae]MTJ85875.1 hypothetical protein [Nocardia seriolae]MTK29869.1 hypothetical protein [Nocardia seriolae]
MAVEPIVQAPVEGPGADMLRFRETQTGYTVLVGPPEADPDLWRRYMDGALEAYRRFDSAEALDYDTVIDGRSTSLFFVALDSDGRVVAGVRAEGPHKHVDEMRAVASWAGLKGGPAFRHLVADQIPYGVIECKAGWAARDSEYRHALAEWMARACVHAAMLLGVRYVTSHAPEHALRLYRSSGANVAWWIPPSSYPDERYRTFAVWWDMKTYRAVATESQARLLEVELSEMRKNDLMPPDFWAPAKGLA